MLGMLRRVCLAFFVSMILARNLRAEIIVIGVHDKWVVEVLKLRDEKRVVKASTPRLNGEPGLSVECEPSQFFPVYKITAWFDAAQPQIAGRGFVLIGHETSKLRFDAMLIGSSATFRIENPSQIESLISILLDEKNVVIKQAERNSLILTQGARSALNAVGWQCALYLAAKLGPNSQ